MCDIGGGKTNIGFEMEMTIVEKPLYDETQVDDLHLDGLTFILQGIKEKIKPDQIPCLTGKIRSAVEKYAGSPLTTQQLLVNPIYDEHFPSVFTNPIVYVLAKESTVLEVENKVLDDKVIQGEVIQDEALQDKVIQDEALQDKVIQDQALQDKVIQGGSKKKQNGSKKRSKTKKLKRRRSRKM